MEKVAIIRCNGYEQQNVDKAVREAFDLFGGANNIIKRGEKVLLKPNLLAPHAAEEAATTHPAMIEALIKIAKEAGAVPFVGDSPAFGSAVGISEKCGIKEVTDRHGVRIVEFGRNIYLKRDKEKGIIPAKDMRGKSGRMANRLTRELPDFDCIINLPKLKAHVQVMLSSSTKNMYGCVSGKVKAFRHFLVSNDLDIFAKMILDIYDLIRPRFTLVDGIIAMDQRGPRGGRPLNTGLIFAGTNCIAIDRVMAEVLGQSPENIPILRVAKKSGFKGTDLKEIEVAGLKISDVRRPDFQFPQNLIQISFDLPRVFKSLIKHIWAKIFNVIS